MAKQVDAGAERADTLLVHACCGPCLAGSVAALRAEAPRLAVFWENPNIHPFVEYQQRYVSLVRTANAFDLPLARGDDAYGLNRFLTALAGAYDQPARCRICYRLRLEATAARARQRGDAGFTTTLFISPYQHHDMLHEVGELAGAAAGVRFVPIDLRPNFARSRQSAKSMGLYRQQYCGCMFSEYDRYRNDARFRLPSGEST